MSISRCTGSYSYAKTFSVVHLWRIDNLQTFFLTPNVENQLLTSNKFITEDGCEWCVVFYPKGDLPDNREHISAFLRLESRARVHARFALSLLDAEGQQLCSFKHNLPYRFRPPDYSILGWSKFFPIKDIGGDTIYLKCCVQSLNRRTEAQSLQMAIDSSVDNMARDMQVFFDSPQFSDVVVKFGTLQCRAHKVVLAARSPVFAAMFSHKMSENTKNEVVINDCEPEIVYEFLRYLYSGNVSDEVLQKHSDSLLALSDQYDVESLKFKCEDVLLSNSLEVDNVIDAYMIADSHRSGRLKKKSINFMRNNMKQLIKDESWKNLCRKRPDIVADIATAVFSDEDDGKDASFSAHRMKQFFAPPF